MSFWRWSCATTWLANRWIRQQFLDQPTPEQTVWLYAIIFILSLIAWAMAAYNGPATFHKWHRSY
jgi:hypothetical protein